MFLSLRSFGGEWNYRWDKETVGPQQGKGSIAKTTHECLRPRWISTTWLTYYQLNPHEPNILSLSLFDGPSENPFAFRVFKTLGRNHYGGGKSKQNRRASCTQNATSFSVIGAKALKSTEVLLVIRMNFYIADLGNFKESFLSMKLIKRRVISGFRVFLFNNCIDMNWY